MLQATLRVVAPQGKRDELLDVLLCLKGPTEVLEGCRACWIVQDVEHGHTLTYVVRWESREHLNLYLRSERFRRLLPYIDMSVEPPQFEISAIEPIGGIDCLLDVLNNSD